MKYKIAICLSGEPRNWDSCVKNYLKIIQMFNKECLPNFFIEVDYFIHSYNEVTHRSSTIIDDFTTQNVINNFYIKPDFDSILKLFAPKEYIIDNKDALMKYIRYFFKDNAEEFLKIKHSNYSRLSQWISASKSIQLCYEFSKRTNTQYDLVIKSRFDALLNLNPKINIHHLINKAKTRLVVPKIWCKNGRTNSEYGVMWGPLHLMTKAWVEDFPYKLPTLQANLKNLKEWEYRDDVARKSHNMVACHSILHYYWTHIKKIEIMCGWPKINLDFKLIRFPTLPEMGTKTGL